MRVNAAAPRDRKTERRAIRLTPEDAAELDARAAAHGLTITEYVTRTALGRLDAQETQIRADLDDALRRLERIERQMAEAPSW